MSATTKKSNHFETKLTFVIELQPEAQQVDFNSKEINEELEKVKQKIRVHLDNAVVDTKKLSAHFTV